MTQTGPVSVSASARFSAYRSVDFEMGFGIGFLLEKFGRLPSLRQLGAE